MKLREECPVYLNPTDSELVELCSEPWDTLRVMESDEVFVVGSGFGNTHETLVQLYKRHVGGGRTKNRWDPRAQAEVEVYVGSTPHDWDPFIFFKRGSTMVCNLGDVGGPACAAPDMWRREFSDERLRQLDIIAQCSDLVAR